MRRSPVSDALARAPDNELYDRGADLVEAAMSKGQRRFEVVIGGSGPAARPRCPAASSRGMTPITARGKEPPATRANEP